MRERLERAWDFIAGDVHTGDFLWLIPALGGTVLIALAIGIADTCTP